MSPQTEEARPFHKMQGDPDTIISEALASNIITEKDAEIIKTYISERTLTRTLKLPGVNATIRLLINARKNSDTYDGAKLADLYAIVSWIKNGISRQGKSFSVASQYGYLVRIKAFFYWLIENDLSHIPKKKIDQIKLPTVSPSIRNSSDLLNSEDITKIIGACKNSRNRAIFSMLYEGGFRIGEVATLRWGAVKFDASGVVVNVKYKTEKMRYVRLIMSKEALAKWKSDYPEAITPESYVFLNNRGQMLNYQAMSRILSRLVDEAGIDKPVTLHLFRHSRITHLIQQNLPESIIKMMMWGSLKTQSFATYAHLSGVDVDREMQKMYGIENMISNTPDQFLEPTICPYCKEICGPNSRYCSACGQLLREGDIKTDEQLQKWLLDNSSLLTEYLNKIRLQREVETG